MCVKVLVVIAIARVQREVRSGFPPSGVRCNLFSIWYPALGYLRWDVGTISRPEPKSNAGISRSRRNVVSATIEVKWRTVGGATEEDTTPFVGVGERVAVVAGGGSVRSYFETEQRRSGSECANRQRTYPVCARPGGIVHPGVVCKLAWFSVLKLIPASRWQ